jgi:exopolysaccharide biosynthesis polyprenyl glycosylphosphotransferase
MSGQVVERTPPSTVAAPRLSASVTTQSATSEYVARARRRELDRSERVPGGHRRSLVRRILVTSDVASLLVAFTVGWLATEGRDADAALLLLLLPLGILVAGFVVIANLHGLYGRDTSRPDHSTIDDLGAIVSSATLSVWLLVAVALLAGADGLGRYVAVWVLALALVPAGRIVARGVLRRREAYVQRSLIVGTGDVGQLVARKLSKHPEYGIRVVGFVDSAPCRLDADVADIPVIGGLDDIEGLIDEYGVERVIVAFTLGSDERAVEVTDRLRSGDVAVDVVPRFFDSVGPDATLHSIEGLALVGLGPTSLTPSALRAKRVFDSVLSAVGLVVLAPVFLALAVAIKLDSPGPVFYRHERLARRGRPFRLFKFRTMAIEFCRGEEYGGDSAEQAFEALMADPELQREFTESYKLQADPRVTRVGRFLRKTSLDELPQLINVLLGDISLVGPRPITEDELERFGRGARQLLDMPPGVTGYWQINGRSDVSYDERVRLEMLYVKSWSLKLDVAILAKTIRVIAARGGAY